MMSFITLLFAKYNWNNQVKEDEMGRACSTERNAYMVLVGKPEGWDGVVCIHLAQDRDHWQSVGNTVNLRVP
jgi:hypothetical protein